MPLGRLIDQFDEKARHCASVAELRQLLEDVALELGFDHFALLHHSSLARRSPRLIRIDTYPAGWEEELLARGFASDDPVHLASGRTNAGFAWDELGDLIPLSARHRAILVQSASFGIGPGYTVPANIPGEPAGSCSFAVRTGRTLPGKRLLCAEQIGAHAFRAARRLHDYPALGARAPLSRRQIQCLGLVAAGKTDWEIARILGLSAETVHHYVKAARAACDVVSRTQLVVRGLRDAWIGFDDAIPPDGRMG